MGKTKYLVRLDDACPTMDAVKWQRMETLLDAYEVKPMVGIIPHCQDPQLMLDEPDPHFWQKNTFLAGKELDACHAWL